MTPAPAGAPIRVLLVEDDADDAAFCLHCLSQSRSETFETEHATSLAAATEALARSDADIVLLDLSLPDAHGVDTVSALLRRFPTQGVVVLTGAPDPAVVRDVLRRGADEFIPKSELDPARLETAVIHAVERTRASRGLELMARFSSDATLLHDEDGRIRSASPAAAQVFALSWEQLEGRRLDELVHPDDAEAVRRAPMSVQGAHAASVQYRVADPSGSRWCETTWRRVPHVHPSERIALVSTTRDISRRRAMTDQLASQQRLEAVGLLAGGVAHDFNNQLAVISGFAQVALRQIDEDHAARRPLSQILRAGQTAAELTRQLLAFGRRQTMAPESFDLSELVVELRTMVQSLLRSGIRLELEPSSEPLPAVADRSQIEQAYVALVEHARRSIDKRGRVRVATDLIELSSTDPRLGPSGRPGPYVRLVVESDGRVLDEAVRARIFEPFFAAHEGEEAPRFGLAGAYGIVRQSRGFLHCTAGAPSGTRFELLLPRATAPESPAESVVTPPAGEFVVVVLDRAGARRSARRVLQEAGHRVRTAEDGAAALELIESLAVAPRLLVTDAALPRLSGHDLVRRARDRFPTLPFVLLTGFADRASGDVELLRDAAGVVRKPFTDEELRSVVAKAVEPRLESAGGTS